MGEPRIPGTDPTDPDANEAPNGGSTPEETDGAPGSSNSHGAEPPEAGAPMVDSSAVDRTDDEGDEMEDVGAPNPEGVDPTAPDLPCGEALDPHTIDIGMREYRCPCGADHAVVTDVHPPSRFFPEAFVETLRQLVDTDDAFEEFGTPHLMGITLEEFPERVVVHDASDDGSVGYALLWVTDFDSRRVHEVIVELVLELMDHAVSHVEDDEAQATFEAQLGEFDVAAFVEEYREQRNFEREGDRPV